MWRLFFACTPDPDRQPEPASCPETCDVTLEVVPPSGLTGNLTVRSVPPGYGFGGALLDASGNELSPIAGLSEAEIELFQGDLVDGEIYTLEMGLACEPGDAQLVCKKLNVTFEAAAAGTVPTTTTTTTGPGGGVTDVSTQVTTPEVDVLFVIDNSCSMNNEQSELTANFPSFMAYFLDSGLDYHIGA